MKGKTVFITGASRGIGEAIGLRLAKEGANIVIAAKTTEAHPKLPGTIFTAAQKMKSLGARVLPVEVDIRDDEQIHKAVEKAAQHFGGIDILINNASAISLTGTLRTPMKKYDLMNQVNGRGTFSCTQACLPHLLKSENPHVLTLSPPLNIEPRWFAPHVAYSIAKYSMSLCVLGFAEEFKKEGVAFNALWPRTTIATAAISNIVGGPEMMERSRKPEIMADAAYFILRRKATECTGNFFIDDNVLREEGVTNLDAYAVKPGTELMPDFFI